MPQIHTLEDIRAVPYKLFIALLCGQVQPGNMHILQAQEVLLLQSLIQLARSM